MDQQLRVCGPPRDRDWRAVFPDRPARLARAGNLSPEVNGWTLTVHSFDYNLDHLGLGTIDDPAWKMADRQASYLGRALAARGGLWGNHGYEAAYPMTYTDADGDQLDGRNRYTLRFAEDPPVDAFWSITMYDLPDFYLAAPFRPIMRLYQPQAAVLDGTYQIPPIVKTAG